MLSSSHVVVSRHVLPAVLVASVLSWASPLAAQIAPSGPPPSGPETSSSLEPGVNSFTETQVRDRLARSGYSQIGPLRKNGDGIWRGEAVHGGNQVSIGVDYRGAIVRTVR